MTYSAQDVRFQSSHKDILESDILERIGNFCCVFRRKEEEFGRYMDAYRGNSSIFCGGRIVMGPKQIRNVSTTLACTIIPSFYFLDRVIPRYEESEVRGFLFWFCVLLLGINILSIFMCSLSNPGIVPRDLGPGTDREDGLLTWANTRTRYIMLNKVELKQKYCTSCHIYRPPRSKHCALCDNCVLRFDHHCVILGACVGLHNYRWFLLLIYSANVHITIAMVVSFSLISRIISENSFGFVDTIEILFEDFALTAFLVYTLVIFLATIILALYHTGITSRNLSTNEHVKNYYKENPFDQGALHNFQHTCCYPEALLMHEESYDSPTYIRLYGSTNSECLSFGEI